MRDEYPAVLQRQMRFVVAGGDAGGGRGCWGRCLPRAAGIHADFLGPAMVATIERHQMWTQSIVGVAPMASSRIMTNNLSVSFITFATGIVFGLGTLFLCSLTAC